MNDDVVVFPARRVGSNANQLARHAEMEEPYSARVQQDQNVFALAGNFRDASARQTRQRLLIDSGPQARLENFHPPNGSPRQMGPQTAANDFDFRQFRHNDSWISSPPAPMSALSTRE